MSGYEVGCTLAVIIGIVLVVGAIRSGFRWGVVALFRVIGRAIGVLPRE